MPLVDPGWGEIALRLVLAAAAGGVIGLERDEHGRPAGLRTTMLVCLAAAIAMILSNLLLPVSVHAAGSFTFDVLRLPLGVLSGMGFLGAGAIIRRSDVVLGLTTAATLWIVTVIGLAIGSGEIGLGLAAAALALVVLWGLKQVERFIAREHRATLILVMAREGPSRDALEGQIAAAGFGIIGEAVCFDAGEQTREVRLELAWRAARREVKPPAFLDPLAQAPGVRRLQWLPEGVPRPS